MLFSSCSFHAQRSHGVIIMPLKVHRRPLPKPFRGCYHENNIRLGGQSSDVPLDDMIFVEGDVWQIYGWLRGLGSTYIEGNMNILLHEGLWAIDGELTAYGAQTHELLNLLLKLINRKLHGIIGQYPRCHYRVTVSYKMTWKEE